MAPFSYFDTLPPGEYPMRSQMKTLATILCLSLAGCATKSDLAALQNDVDEVKAHTLRVEKDIAGVRGIVREDVEKKNLALQEELVKIKKNTQELQTELQKELDNFRKGAADLQANLDSAKVDMRVLNGKIESFGQQVKKPGEDLSLLREDFERRVSTFDERLKKLESALDEVEKKTEAQRKEAQQTPDQLYQKGLSLMKEGKPQQARESLNKFLELYPSNSLAPNARYWVGETYYTEKNFEQAILEFQQLIESGTGKEKIPAAMLKQGMAWRELGDPKNSRFVYNRLIERFPSSPEAKTAREKIKELR